MNKKFMVWFEQINRDMIEVEARNEDEARIKAERDWLMYNEPEIQYVQVVNLGLSNKVPETQQEQLESSAELKRNPVGQDTQRSKKRWKPKFID